MIGVDILPIAILFAGDFLCLDFCESRNNPRFVCGIMKIRELDPISYHVADIFEECYLNRKHEGLSRSVE